MDILTLLPEECLKESPLIVTTTGHRPPAIGGYDSNNPTRLFIRNAIYAVLRQLQDYTEGNLRLISGFAQGVDLDSATIAHALNIPVDPYLVRSFTYQSSKWPRSSKYNADQLLRNVLSAGGRINLQARDYHQRDRLMVKDGHIGLAVLRSDVTEGGTFYTVNQMNKQYMPYFLIDPVFETVSSSHVLR